MMTILGIDPGLNGGCAMVRTFAHPQLLSVIEIPTHGEKAKRRVDAGLLYRYIQQWKPQAAFIERAQAMPAQGSSSGFSYGRAVGAIEAAVACAGVPITIIEPSVWKRKMGLPGGKNNKEASRQRAIQLFPGSINFKRKKDHQLAEAALIALYGMQFHLGANVNYG